MFSAQIDISPPTKNGAQYKKLCLDGKLSTTNLSVKKYALQNNDKIIETPNTTAALFLFQHRNTQKGNNI